MPRFFRDMPFPKAGEYDAIVLHYTPFTRLREVKIRRVRGYWRAYIVARFMALFDDWATPCDEIGIKWAVRKDRKE
jgi:hypothetical protein